MNHLHYALRVANRLIFVFFTAPASTGVFLVLMVYDFSPYAVAHDLYDQITAMVQLSKTAPAGYVGMVECLDPISTSHEIVAAPIGCQKPTVKFWSTDDLARDTVESLWVAYWLMLSLGVMFAMLCMGPKKFFLMDAEAPLTST